VPRTPASVSFCMTSQEERSHEDLAQELTEEKLRPAFWIAVYKWWIWDSDASVLTRNCTPDLIERMQELGVERMQELGGTREVRSEAC
jgi:hypothetical protein